MSMSTTSAELDDLLEEVECRMVWRNAQSDALLDTTRYLDIEGAFRAAKTTIGLWKAFNYLVEHPGMNALICRWTDDATFAILRPVWRAICAKAGVPLRWNSAEGYDELENGARCYIRGLKASEETNRYGKFRGLTLAHIYHDQAEETPYDVFLELKARLSQPGYPQQLVITPNPPSDDHWIAREFPETNHIVDHKYIRLTIYDNAHNLDPKTIAGLEQTYPPGHSKHGPAILGTRGLNVKGQPVYAGKFKRALHVRPTAMNPDLPLLEAIDFGKHHPCVHWSQFDPWGGWTWLGGMMGRDLFIEDFAPMIKQQRAEWFPNALEVQTCCDPAGSHNNSQGVRTNGVKVLADHGIVARWIDNSNAPDVRRGAIEQTTAYLNRRSARGEEAFACDDQRWRIVGDDQDRLVNFAAQALEAGYVWDERTRTTAGGKSIVVPLKDGWFEHVMNCSEYAVLNFGQGVQTEQQVQRHAERVQREALRRAQRDPGERFTWSRRSSLGRGGYR